MHVTSEYVGDVDSNDLFQKAKTEHYFRMAEEFFRMARYGAAQDALARVFALDATSRQASSLKKKIARAQKEIALLANPSSNGHARSAKRGELVLVVDQDERVLSSLVATLQRYGFTPTGAASFEEAIDVLTSYKPNLILSEVNFQNGPVGFDLYYWLRHNTTLSSVPFLYLVTTVTREMLIAGKRMGVDEFILKPLDEEVVMATVLNCLARRKNHHM